MKNKVVNIEELVKILKDQTASGKRVVFTNGCFDILHAGHVIYLTEAKSLGDLLVVGLNSDSSIKRLKGENRPVVPEEERAAVLSGLESVDYIVVFTEDTPYNAIKALQPNILVKGGDWSPDQIVGYDVVLKNGGEVKSLSFVNGLSTTNIITKILQIYKIPEN